MCSEFKLLDLAARTLGDTAFDLETHAINQQDAVRELLVPYLRQLAPGVPLESFRAEMTPEDRMELQRLIGDITIDDYLGWER